jgi:predicted RNA-binding protein with EMAP domain
MQIKSLKNIVATLQKLRDAYHSQLDASDLGQLDEVLDELTRLMRQPRKEVSLGEVALRALRVIDSIIRLVTNLTDLMK